MLEIPRLRVAKYSFRRILYISDKDANISKPIGADTHVLDELIVYKKGNVIASNTHLNKVDLTKTCVKGRCGACG